MIQANDSVPGREFTVVNGYGWGARSEFPMKKLSAYKAWQERMMQRSMVRKSVESEGSV